MTTSSLRQRNSAKPIHHEVSLCVDFNPISQRYLVTVTERHTGEKASTGFRLDTDGVIALEELEELLGTLDARAHMACAALLDVQLHLF